MFQTLWDSEKNNLFGAISATANRLKGFQYLKKALSELEKMKSVNKNKLSLLIFGISYSKDIEKFPFEVKFLGRLYDDFSLALSYSAPDVFVTSSIQDNLPNIVMESLFCETPVAGFNIGGIPDVIDHKINGYLAEYKSSQFLAEGIKWILEDENRALNSEKLH